MARKEMPRHGKEMHGKERQGKAIHGNEMIEMVRKVMIIHGKT
jgi:hypothetical protein